MQKVDYNPFIIRNGEKVRLEEVIQREGRPLTSYLEYDRKKKEFVRHIYASRTSKKGFECMEVFRERESGKKIGKNFYYNEYSCGAGLHIVWKHTNAYYYGEIKKVEDFKENPYIEIKWFNHYQLTNIDDIIGNDESLKYCKWNSNVDALEFIKIYRKYPIVEMLMKLELYHLALNSKCLDYMTNNKSFCKWIYANSKEIKENLISLPSIKHSFIHKCNVSDYNSSTIEKRRKAREISQDLGSNIYHLIKGHCNNYDKLIDYARKVGRSNYRDYIEACNYFKLDLSDTKVLYPEDFKKWHDYYTNQMMASKSKDIDDKIKQQGDKYTKMLSINDEIKMSFPKCTQDFIDEGEALHHCVGRMGYNKKMANGESLIIFVRKEENKPLYTMEYDPKGKKIKQLYGDHDTPPEDIVRDIIYNVWLPKVKKMRFA